MKTIIYSLILLSIVGCQTVKETESSEFQSLDKKITVTINKTNEQYSVEVDWTEIKAEIIGNEESGIRDHLSIPKVTGDPNKWMTVRVVQSHENNPKTKILIDDEFIEVPEGFGMTAKVFVTPIEQTKVSAKGVTSISKITAGLSEHMEVPFSGTFVLGEPKTIYYRTEKK